MTDAFDSDLGFEPDLDLESARTPPAEWYTSASFLERERIAIFERNWLYAGPSDLVRNPGDYLSGDVLGEPWIVVRGEDGELRALSNVCRHHAACLLGGEGHVDEIVCPYHGWRYALDGSLRGAPQLGRTDAFDPKNCSLPQFNVRELGPFVFLHLGSDRRSIEQDLAPLLKQLDGWSSRQPRWVARRVYPMECNWKVFADNYLDGGYHIEHLHKGLDAQLDMKSYRTTLFDRFSIQSASSAGEAAPVTDSMDFAERIGKGTLYAYVYPNFMVNRYGPIMDINWIRPVSVDRSEVVFDYWFEETEGAEAERFIQASLEASDQVQQEDVDICRQVQRGVSSKSYDRGVYASVETAMLHFHRLLYADLSRD